MSSADINESGLRRARLLGIRSALEALIDGVVQDPGEGVGGTGPDVAVDVFERADRVTILIELPGVAPEEITLSACGRRLVVEGHRKPGPAGRSAAGVIQGRYLCVERVVGRFRRSIELPVPTDTHRATARLRDGVLNISVPRIEERRGTPHAIPVLVATTKEGL